MEGWEVGVAFLYGECPQGKSENYVVYSIGFWSGGYRRRRDRDLGFRSHGRGKAQVSGLI